jgi:hypothetical protein
MVIELSGVKSKFGLKSNTCIVTKSHKCETRRSAFVITSLISVSPKLRDTKFNFHFFILIFKS